MLAFQLFLHISLKQFINRKDSSTKMECADRLSLFACAVFVACNFHTRDSQESVHFVPPSQIFPGSRKSVWNQERVQSYCSSLHKQQWRKQYKNSFLKYRSGGSFDGR